MFAHRWNFRVIEEIASRNKIVTLDFRLEMAIRPFCACAMHPAIIVTKFSHCGLGYWAGTTFHRTYY